MLSQNNIYSSKQILEWEKKLNSLPIEIKQNEYKIEQSREKIKQLEEDLSDQKDKIIERKNTIKSLKARISILQNLKEIDNLQQIIPPHEKQIEELTPKLSEYDAKINPLKDEIKQLDKYIAIKNAQQELEKATHVKNTNESDKIANEHNLEDNKIELSRVNSEIQYIEPQIRDLQEALNRQDRERRERDNQERIRRENEQSSWERQEYERQQAEKRDWQRNEEVTQSQARVEWEQIERNVQRAEDTSWERSEVERRSQEDRRDREEHSRFEQFLRDAATRFDIANREESSRHEGELRSMRSRHSEQEQTETRRYQQELEEIKNRQERERRELHHHRHPHDQGSLGSTNPQPAFSGGSMGATNPQPVFSGGSMGATNPQPAFANQGSLGLAFAPQHDGERHRRFQELKERHEREIRLAMERHRLERDGHERDRRNESNQIERNHVQKRSELESRYNQEKRGLETRERERQCAIRENRERREREHRSTLQRDRDRREQEYQRLQRQQHNQREAQFLNSSSFEHGRRVQERQATVESEKQLYQSHEEQRRRDEQPERTAKENKLYDLRAQLNQLQSNRIQIERTIADLRSVIDTCNKTIESAQQTIERSQLILKSMSAEDFKNADQKQLPLFESQWRDCVAKRDLLIAEKKEIELKIEKHVTEIKKSQNQIDMLRQQNLNLTPDATLFASVVNLSDLELTLTDTGEQKSGFEREKLNIENKIKELNNDIEKVTGIKLSTQSELDRLERDKFLTSLRDDPQSLFRNLVNKIKIAFDKYDEDHPSGQSVEVQICIVEKESIIKQIMHHENEYEPGDAKEADKAIFNKTFFCKYQWLCGYLRYLQETIANSANNTEFRELIESLFEKDILEASESLEAFIALNLKEMDYADLVDYRFAEYKKVEAILESELENTPEGSKEFQSLYEKGRDVLKVIKERQALEVNPNLHSENHESKDISVSKGKFDLTNVDLHKRVLQKTQALLKSPGDKKLQDQYKQLIALQKTGHSSLCQKLCGILFAFVGAAIVAASVVAGFSVGFGIASAGITFGSGLCLSGIALFCNGRSKGPVKKMETFLASATKVKPEYVEKNVESEPGMETNFSTTDMSPTVGEGQTEPSAPPYYALSP